MTFVVKERITLVVVERTFSFVEERMILVLE
jgi:hypothetical protein